MKILKYVLISLVTCLLTTAMSVKVAATVEKSVLELADEYRTKGDIDKAIEVLQQAIENKERPWPELTVLGECYTQQKKYALAEKALKKAMKIESNPKFISHIYRAYGDLYLEQKKFRKASGYFKKALRFADTPFKKADAYYHLAMLDYHQGRIDSAKENIKKSLELAPDNIYFNNFLKQLDKASKNP